jgi:hypothetical protein
LIFMLYSWTTFSNKFSEFSQVCLTSCYDGDIISKS